MVLIPRWLSRWLQKGSLPEKDSLEKPPLCEQPIEQPITLESAMAKMLLMEILQCRCAVCKWASQDPQRIGWLQRSMIGGEPLL